MKKPTILLLTFFAINSFAQGITGVNATKVILPSTYYSSEAYTVPTYVINPWEYTPWGTERDCYGAPPADNQGKQWYQNGYTLTDGESSWSPETSPFFSGEYYNGMPSFRWTTDNYAADIYFIRSFTINEKLPSNVYLAFGHDDGCSEFYINGTLVVQTATNWDESAFTKLSDEQRALIKTDGSENIIAVHVHNNFGGAFADCGIYAIPEDAANIGNLAMGFNAPWTARLLFNSEGGYNYQNNNNESEIHGWEKLYEAKADDVYSISMPTAAMEPDWGKVQFKTPINLEASHKYSFKATILSDKNIDDVNFSLCENENADNSIHSSNFSLRGGSAYTINLSNLTGTTISDLMIAFGFPTEDDNTTIKVSGMSLVDNTTNTELWVGTSYYNYMYYYDLQSNTRIPDMKIVGRQETMSWAEAEFDDSMWETATMPIGNWGYMSEVRTIWPGGDNTNYWIRRTFELDEVKGTTAYTLNVCHDDAYSIYVNGHLIDTASGWTDGKNFIKLEVPARFLQVGKNVIATYIQQNWGGKFYDCGMTAKENAYEDSDIDVDKPGSLIANEIEVANIDQIIDNSFNYGAWIELYNKSDKRIALDYLYVSDDPQDLRKFMLPANSGVIQPKGYRCIFFDHNSADGVYGDTANKQVAFKLNNDGGTIYISEDGKTPFITATYPAAISRCSYARKSVDSDEWGMNGEPTPNAANSDKFANTRLTAPVVDTDSRLFTDNFDISVTIPQGATLRYTTDGTAPTLSNGQTSTDGKFNVFASCNYRFRLFQDGYLPSPVVTRSYIYRDNDYYLPVISITTDNANLYDDTIGVYVDGTNGVAGRNHGASNINMDWERPVNFEYITADNKMGVNMEAEFTISGGWSRHYAPASFKIKATKVNEGKNSIDFPFFPCKPHNKYKQILIRNGGNDNDSQYHGRVRDAITQETLISSGFYVDAQDYQPVHVFFNGRYIAQLNLREPNNKYNGTANYGYDDDEMDAFEYSNGYFQMAGTKDAFNEWLSIARNAADASAYETLRQKVDIDEYTNYWAAVSYIGCSDWICNNNNVKGYRSLPDGKFHLTILDQDWGWSNTSALYNLEGNYGNELLQIYNYTKQNPDYRRQFVDAYCILNGSVFAPERCEAFGDSICNLVAPALAFEGKEPWGSYNEQKNNMTSESARASRMSALRNCYGLDEGMNIQLRSTISEASFRINNQPVPTGKFNGTLFAPVDIEVSAPSGYTFGGWKALQSYAFVPFSYGSEWRYYDQGSLDNQPSWTRAKTDSWGVGNAPLGYGKSDIATTINYGDDASNKYPTYYFRKDFTLDTALNAEDEVRLNYVEDDGFVIYVNGREAGRYNMPEGDITFDTYAPTYANGNPDRGTLMLDASLFQKGTNRIAVEVHNNVAGSSDIYWDAELSIVSASSDDIISTNRTLSLEEDQNMELIAIFNPLPDEYLIAAGQTPVVINEVSASNSIFVNDYYKKNDWIELYNTTNEDIDVAGMYISDNPSKPEKYQIAKAADKESTIIPAHGYLVIWADKLDPLSQLHATFKLGNADGEMVILTAEDGSWCDSLVYMAHTGEETVGRYPDGGSRIYKMTKPTINAQNTLTTYAEWISGENEDFDLEKYLQGIDNPLSAANGTAKTEYFSIDGMRLNSLQRGVNIIRQTNADGTVTTRRVVIK